MADKKFKYKVIKEFRDIDNFEKVHKVEEELTKIKGDRLRHLIDLKLVSKEEIKEEAPPAK